MFEGRPKEYTTTMAEKEYPELDSSELFDSTGTKPYQYLIGALQWLGRFDIHLSVTTMSRYRISPRQVQLDCLNHIYGYLRRHSDSATRFRTKNPDHDCVVTPIIHYWASAVYRKRFLC
jgi:hypothetical protein